MIFEDEKHKRAWILNLTHAHFSQVPGACAGAQVARFIRDLYNDLDMYEKELQDKKK